MKLFFIIFPLVIAIICNSAANILMKRAAAQNAESFIGLYLNPYFIFGAIFFGINMIFYAKALQKIPLNLAYPVLVGLSLLSIVLFSIIFQGERVLLQQAMGMLLVVVGIYFILSGG
jgi:undecaprenyl phosphate-alpha-L-ara4N flippase subunit ArnE